MLMFTDMFNHWMVSNYMIIVIGPIILGLKKGRLRSRLYCREVIQCRGIGDNVFWSILGLRSVPIANTDARFTNVSSLITLYKVITSL